MNASRDLLVRYVRTGSESAFSELVTAYIDFVHATALRIVAGDRALAEDISQTVFTDLATQARAFSEDVKLGGWLHRHTCFIAQKALRRERRRKRWEMQSVELRLITDYTHENLNHLSSVLDEAINDLKSEDRSAIVLRFFDDLDFRSVGEALGSTEDAARMRVSRAVEKLGSLLRRRGFTLSVSGLAYVLATKTASAAPADLALFVCRAALESPRSVPFLTIAKQCCLTRLNLTLVSTAGAVAALTLFLVIYQANSSLVTQPRNSGFIAQGGQLNHAVESSVAPVAAIVQERPVALPVVAESVPANTPPPPLPGDIAPVPSVAIPIATSSAAIPNVSVNPPAAPIAAIQPPTFGPPVIYANQRPTPYPGISFVGQSKPALTNPVVKRVIGQPSSVSDAGLQMESAWRNALLAGAATANQPWATRTYAPANSSQAPGVRILNRQTKPSQRVQ